MHSDLDVVVGLQPIQSRASDGLFYLRPDRYENLLAYRANDAVYWPHPIACARCQQCSKFVPPRPGSLLLPLERRQLRRPEAEAVDRGCLTLQLWSETCREERGGWALWRCLGRLVVSHALIVADERECRRDFWCSAAAAVTGVGALDSLVRRVPLRPAQSGRNQLHPGDLVFYATNLSDPATIHHVGIYTGNGYMIDAPYTGAVIRFDSIDQADYIGAVRPKS